MNLKSQYRYPEIVIQILTLKNWTRKRPKHLVISYKQCEKHMWIISYKLYRNPSILSRSILLPVRDDLFHVRDIYHLKSILFCVRRALFCARSILCKNHARSWCLSILQGLYLQNLYKTTYHGDCHYWIIWCTEKFFQLFKEWGNNSFWRRILPAILPAFFV